MAKNDEEEEQLALIDVSHPAAKGLRRVARAYKKAVGERTAALAIEIEKKKQLLAAAKEIGAKPDADGKIKFHMDDFTVTVKPRDELVQVKFDDATEEDESE